MLFAHTAYSANGKMSTAPECVPIAEKHKLINKLNQMGEVALFTGMSLRGPHMVEIFININTKTWTAVGTDPVRVCVLDFGKKITIEDLSNVGDAV